MSLVKKGIRYLGMLLLAFIVLNAVRIYIYASEYSETKSDVAIVLGAGTSNNTISPVFRERINHAIYLYENECVGNIILTGGMGENQTVADSEVARDYAMSEGLPANDLHIEISSRYTHENLFEAQKLMDSLNFSTALIVTDPIHLKRSIDLARSMNLNCEPSPTQTSMYRSTLPKFQFLMYETLFYTLGKLCFWF